MDNQSQFFYSSIFKISISPKNYHFSSLDWAFKLICEKSGINFIIEPYIRFQGEVGEQATMFFLDPSNNALEFKAFRDDQSIFAT